MSKYIGCGASIKKIEEGTINTLGKCCTILEWDKKLGKYKVDFHDGFVGWYKRSQLGFDKEQK